MSGRTIGNRLAIAQARAEAARSNFGETLGRLQHRASPQVLAQDVAETLKQRGIDALIGMADTAKREPARVGIALALLGLFLGRRQILRVLRRTTAPAPTLKSPEKGSIK